MRIYRAMCETEAIRTLAKGRPDFKWRFKWFSTNLSFIYGRVKDGEFNNSKHKPERYTRVFEFETSEPHKAGHVSDNELQFDRHTNPNIKLIGEVTMQKLISIQAIKAAGLDVDVIIDMSQQAPNAHQDRQYEAAISYGFSPTTDHFMIFVVRAEIAVTDEGAKIKVTDADKLSRRFYMQGVEGMDSLAAYAPHFEDYFTGKIPLAERTLIDGMFDIHAPTSDTLPPHRIHYVNADMTNPNHRPHPKS